MRQQVHLSDPVYKWRFCTIHYVYVRPRSPQIPSLGISLMQSYSLQTVSGRGRRTVRGAAWRRAGRGARMADQYVHQAAGTHQTSERREAQVPVCRTGHPGRHLRGQDLPEDSGQRLHAVLTWNRWGSQGRISCLTIGCKPLYWITLTRVGIFVDGIYRRIAASGFMQFSPEIVEVLKIGLGYL